MNRVTTACRSGEYLLPERASFIAHNLYSYKYAGANATDETGTLDRVEFINVSKDDAISWPTPTHRTYPSTVNARMESTIIPFVRKSLDVTNTILDVLNDRLGLPKGAIAKRHSLMEHSGGEARCIKSPKNLEMSADKATLGAHTDFGSLVSSKSRCHLSCCLLTPSINSRSFTTVSVDYRSFHLVQTAGNM